MEATYDAVFEKTREIVNNHDPINLIAIGAPWDEYDPEIKDILKHFADVKHVDELIEIVWEIFVRWFDKVIAGAKERYRALSQDLWDLKNLSCH